MAKVVYTEERPARKQSGRLLSRGCRALLDWTAEGGCPHMSIAHACIPYMVSDKVVGSHA